MIEIGRVGIWTGQFDAFSTAQVRDVVQELEGQGWPCVWRPESSGRDALVSAAHMLDATSVLRVATGIAQIHARHPHTTAPPSARCTRRRAAGSCSGSV